MRAAKAAAIIGAIFAVLALGMSGGRAAMSVVVGGAIAIANLLTMRAIIRSFLPPEPEGEEDTPKPDPSIPNSVHRDVGRRAGAAWAIFAVLKIFILFGGLWFLLTRGLVDPIPLLVGYGVLPLGIAASALRPRRD